MQFASSQIDGGKSVDEVARKLGLDGVTLRRWLRRERRAKAAFAPVRMEPVKREEPVGGVVVHGPGGLRIEGMGVEEVAELLRRLQ